MLRFEKVDFDCLHYDVILFWSLKYIKPQCMLRSLDFLYLNVCISLETRNGKCWTKCTMVSLTGPTISIKKTITTETGKIFTMVSRTFFSIFKNSLATVYLYRHMTKSGQYVKKL